jgi:hypothetical protein
MLYYRKYWMIYGPGFLAVLWFGSSPIPSPSLVSNLSFFLTIPVCRRSSILTGKVVGGAESYDREKAWPSINHSILSALLFIYQRARFCEPGVGICCRGWGGSDPWIGSLVGWVHPSSGSRPAEKGLLYSSWSWRVVNSGAAFASI